MLNSPGPWPMACVTWSASWWDGKRIFFESWLLFCCNWFVRFRKLLSFCCFTCCCLLLLPASAAASSFKSVQKCSQNGPATQPQLSATQLQLSRVAIHTFQALELHISGSELHSATHCNSEPCYHRKSIVKHVQLSATHCNSEWRKHVGKTTLSCRPNSLLIPTPPSHADQIEKTKETYLT